MIFRARCLRERFLDSAIIKPLKIFGMSVVVNGLIHEMNDTKHI